MGEMRIGSLFSGIGGLERGLELAGLGAVAWQVEMSPFCRKVLARHYPHAQRYEDVREVGKHNLTPVDLVCGGFPCQDISSAGKRAGLAGARSGLWYEYLRVVRELSPRWVVVENVASGANAWVDPVCAGLAEQGYTCLPIPLSAADVGACHLRKRVFVVAHLNAHRQPTVAEHAETPRAQAVAATHPGWQTVPPMVRVVNGLPHRVDRIRALGNSVVPQCAEVVGWVIRKLEE